MGSSFDEAIKEHLELRRRNEHLEATFPLERYRARASSGQSGIRPERPVRLEETQELTAPPWLSSGEGEPSADSSWLLDEPPSFDWGD